MHTFEHALQVDVLINGKMTCTNYQEGCERVHFDDRTTHPTLLAEFVYRNGHARAKLVVEPEPLIEWSTLVTNKR